MNGALGLPKKLKSDPIAEALCEIRFESRESIEMPEFALGKLAGNPKWTGFNAVRLPISDIPAPVRRQDANLKHQASVELRGQSNMVIKLGTNVASLHWLAPYPGWERFSIEIYSFFNFVFSALTDFSCTRLGFRYVNTFTQSRHGIAGVDDLNFELTVGGDSLSGPVNLNYIKDVSETTQVLVRVAAPSFVSGNNLPDLRALVDIDVCTKDAVVFSKPQQANAWVDQAHDALKAEFFSLFTDDMSEKLIEE